MFEDARRERLFFLLLSSADPDILKQSNFTDHEKKIKTIKSLAPEKLHRRRFLIDYVAVSLNIYNSYLLNIGISKFEKLSKNVKNKTEKR